MTPEGLAAWANVGFNGRRIEDEDGRVGWWRFDGKGWVAYPSLDAFDLGYVLDVVPSADSLVAVGGTVFSIRGLRAGLVLHTWTSADRTNWDQRDSEIGNAGNASLGGVAARGGRQVAVGTRRIAPTSDAIFLVRDGDGPWRSLDVPGAATDGVQSAFDVCAEDAGFVAVGKGAQGPAWFSPDGLKWQQVAADAGDLRACGVTSRGFVAVGTAFNQLAVFRSPNGVDWTPVSAVRSTPTPKEEFTARGIAAESDDVLVYGSTSADGETGVAMWRSTDAGQTWRRLNVPRATFEGLYEGYVSDAVIFHGIGYVAGVVDGEAVVWSSPLAEAG